MEKAIHADEELKEKIENMLERQFGVKGLDLKFKEMGKRRIYAYRNCEDLGVKLKKISQGI